MAKQLVFEYDGVTYTLEYTRKSIEQMEGEGFRPQDIVDKPISTLPALFAGAFYAHHRFVKREKVDEIFAQMGDKEALLEKLAEMYQDPILTLLEEPAEGKKIMWEARW